MIMCWQPVRIEQNAHAPGKIKMPYGRSAKGANTKYIISQTHTHKNCSTMHFKHFSTPTWSTLERAADQLMRGAEKNLVDICVCEQWGSKTERVLKVRIIESRRPAIFHPRVKQKSPGSQRAVTSPHHAHWSGWFLSAIAPGPIKHKGLLLRGNPLHTPAPSQHGPLCTRPAPHYALPPKQNPTISYSREQLPFLLHTHRNTMHARRFRIKAAARCYLYAPRKC